MIINHWVIGYTIFRQTQMDVNGTIKILLIFRGIEKIEPFSAFPYSELDGEILF